MQTFKMIEITDCGIWFSVVCDSGTYALSEHKPTPKNLARIMALILSDQFLDLKVMFSGGFGTVYGHTKRKRKKWIASHTQTGS